MRPTAGVVPVIVCLLLAGALGAWGWQDRDEARERARTERAARDAVDDPFVVEGDGFDLEWIDACSQLLLVAGLTPPSATPSTPEGTTVAVSGDDLARELLDILETRPGTGVPPLEGSRVQDAIAGIEARLIEAIDRSDDPLSEPEVIEAASLLDAALIGIC